MPPSSLNGIRNIRTFFSEIEILEAAAIEIRKIPAEDTYEIRQQVLRPGGNPTEVHFEGDEHEESFHLGAFISGRLLGITSFMQNSQPYFHEKSQYQMRGMAVLPEARGKRVGKELLKEGERLLREEKKVELLWFNARESAEGFYLRNLYHTRGDYFDIPKVCTHIVMYKNL